MELDEHLAALEILSSYFPQDRPTQLSHVREYIHFLTRNLTSKIVEASTLSLSDQDAAALGEAIGANGRFPHPSMEELRLENIATRGRDGTVGLWRALGVSSVGKLICGNCSWGKATRHSNGTESGFGRTLAAQADGGNAEHSTLQGVVGVMMPHNISSSSGSDDNNSNRDHPEASNINDANDGDENSKSYENGGEGDEIMRDGVSSCEGGGTAVGAGDEGATAFAAGLASNTCLTSLDVGPDGEVSSRGFGAIGRALGVNTKLSRLALWVANVADEGATDVAEVNLDT